MPTPCSLTASAVLTYGDAALQLAQRAAAELRAVSQGLPVLLSGPNTVEWVLCFLAARAAGLMVAPLSEEMTEAQWRAFSHLLGPCYRVDAAQGVGALVNTDAEPRQSARRGSALACRRPAPPANRAAPCARMRA